MFGAGATRQARRRETADTLFARIGALLEAQGLSCDPANYAFAHHLLTRTDADAVAIVRAILEDGIRLSGREIAALGGTPVAGAPMAASTSPVHPPERVANAAPEPANDHHHRAAEQAHRQVAAVAAMVRSVHDETRDFGRDLARSAAAFGDAPGAGPILDMTAAMIARVADAEGRLADATREADALRVELAAAQASARLDPLTGLPNRRALDEAFARLDPALGHCLALCDVDRFKSINDRFGHPVGDRVLAMLARLLGDHFPGQIVARQGGEEFAVLLSGVDLATAARQLDAARAAAAAKRLRDRDTGAAIGSVTFSGGIVAIAAGEPRGDAFARADALLYRAKAEGRDRIVSAPEPGPVTTA